MIWIAIAFCILVVLAIFISKRSRGESGADASFPYTQVEALFTPAERSFFGVLTQAVGKDIVPFGKVRVADVLAVRNGLEKSARGTAFNRISGKHFDFVLCAASDLSVICAIELNDKSHANKKRQERDNFLENACKAAGLPLITVPAQAAYAVAEVKSAIAAAITPQQTMQAPVHKAEITNKTRMEPTIATQPAEVVVEDPVCPKCSGPMVKRIAKAGNSVGQEFWGCSKFPSCRGMVST